MCFIQIQKTDDLLNSTIIKVRCKVEASGVSAICEMKNQKKVRNRPALRPRLRSDQLADSVGRETGNRMPFAIIRGQNDLRGQLMGQGPVKGSELTIEPRRSARSDLLR